MMKRINYKKRAVIHGLSMAVFLGACLGVQANDHEKGVSAQATVNTDRSTTSSTDRNESGKLSRGDANFVKEAAQGGMMEVKMGQTAKDHGQNADVKNYGEMLVKDHGKANERLTKLASQKGVNLAKEMEPKHTDMIQDMEKKSGPDFDRAFIEHAIKDHRKDISKFERASRDLNDSELKSFASETLPTLRHHLDEAERIAKSMGVNITARNVDTDAEQQSASISAAGSAGAPGLATSSGNSSVNRVDVDVNHKDRAPGGRVDLDVDRNRDAGVKADVDIDRNNKSSVEGKAEVDTDKRDGKTLGIETQPGDNRTLGLETKKGDNKVLGVETKPDDGKTLGLNTSKNDGKLLGIIPAPGRNKAENRVDVDLDKSDHSVEVNANGNIDRDRDAAIGGPASTEKGASAKAEVHADKDHDNAKATTLTYNDLPAKVQDTIKAQGGSADNTRNVKKQTRNGKTVYMAKVNGKTLQIAEDGTIIKESGNNK
jgi:putative membrane protein